MRVASILSSNSSLERIFTKGQTVSHSTGKQNSAGTFVSAGKNKPLFGIGSPVGLGKTDPIVTISPECLTPHPAFGNGLFIFFRANKT